MGDTICHLSGLSLDLSLNRHYNIKEITWQGSLRKKQQKSMVDFLI